MKVKSIAIDTAGDIYGLQVGVAEGRPEGSTVL